MAAARSGAEPAIVRQANQVSAGTPLISAILPLYNGEKYLAEAIQSVLSQTHRRVECIVIDDGSTDGGADIASGFGDRIRVVRQANAGVSAARNKGAHLARGEFLAFIDQDDVWLAERCERLLELLSRTDATMALCAVVESDADLKPLEVRRLRSPGDLLEGMLFFDRTTTVSASSAALVPRDQFLELGGFDEGLGMSADWDLLARNLLAGRLEYVDEPLVLYRQHGDNWSRNVSAMESDMLRAFEKVFSDPALPSEVRRRKRSAYSRLYRMLAGSYWDTGNRKAAVRCATESLYRDPSMLREFPRFAFRGFKSADRAAAQTVQ